MDAAVNLRDPVSIHARHATGDTPLGKSPPSSRRFQFTPVMRRATGWVHPRQPSGRFNSRPSCDGRPDGYPRDSRLDVSIHARHATGDAPPGEPIRAGTVSSHARHATGDPFRMSVRFSDFWFQFTPVMRRATPQRRARIQSSRFQFTPVMRRATCGRRDCARTVCFNSRPSCDGRPNVRTPRSWKWRFNSRPSCDGRPASSRVVVSSAAVSIHARHATGDLNDEAARLYPSFQFTPVMRRATREVRMPSWPDRFNSRPSCDGRPRGRSIFTLPKTFQFTPVMRRAT